MEFMTEDLNWRVEQLAVFVGGRGDEAVIQLHEYNG